MIICNKFSDKTIYVAGLGKTGLGAVKSLLASSAKVYAWDDNPTVRNDCVLKYNDLQIVSPNDLNWKQIDFLLPTPGMPTLKGKEHDAIKYAMQNNVKIISDIDILYMACPEAGFIAITGTNGKSTTTALIGHVFTECGVKTEVGGNIGISVLELEPLHKDQIFVLELSSYQLDLLSSAKFDVAILLNITPDHLEHHGTMENYINAKFKIFRNQKQYDKAIISVDYQEHLALISKLQAPLGFSTKNPTDIYIRNRIIIDNINNLKFDLSDYKLLPGEHNEENIAAAYAACISMGLNPEKIVKAIKTFKGLAHRIELVLEKNGVKFINDSKATNAASVEKAFNCFDTLYWIAGGLPKTDGIHPLRPLLQKVKHAFLIGKAQDEFAEVLSKERIPYTKAFTLENALDNLKKFELSNCVVLLSPACASWDQFKSFEHRGDEFKRLVIEKFG
jgi:UDP-N-acetylmuramoylalanine--D-glutamate ligase